MRACSVVGFQPKPFPYYRAASTAIEIATRFQGHLQNFTRNFSSVGEHPETLEGRVLTRDRGSILFSPPLADAYPYTGLINRSFAKTSSVGLRSDCLGRNKFLLNCPCGQRLASRQQGNTAGMVSRKNGYNVSVNLQN